MKRLLWLLLLSTAFAQTQTIGSITTTGSTCVPATNCVLSPVAVNSGTVSLTVSGTYSGTLQFEASADNQGSWVGITGYPQPSGAGVTSTTSTGTWIFPAAGWTYFRVRASSLASGTAVASILPGTNVPVFTSPVSGTSTVQQANTAGSTDPCQNPAVLKSSAKITLNSTTAQELVATSGSKVIYVCGFMATLQGSATTVDTLQFETGTKVTNPCDTSTATLTSPFQGNINANVPTVVASGSAMTQFASITGGDFCAVATGTTISVNGYITYVQQ